MSLTFADGTNREPMRRMRDRLPHIESSLVKVGNAHVDQVKIVQVCVEDIEGCQFGEYIPIPKPYFDASATKFRRFRNQNQTRFRNQEKALPQPKKDDSATKKKTIPQPKKKRFRNPKKRISQPKKTISQPPSARLRRCTCIL